MANNRIVHFEIPANQPAELAKFYTELFGWKFQKAPRPGPEYWLDATIERATKLGAKVALPRTAVPGVGAYAALIDPQGNLCGLWEQSGQ